MEPLYAALFADYDNVVIELTNDDSKTGARFSQRPTQWLEALHSKLPLYEDMADQARRIVSRRCYASPQRIDRHREAFTRSGFEVIDCPPLTRQLKNSADISIVMDIIEYLERYPYITEYIVLSADADFTPVLTRLRKELKRSVIFSSLNTASSYKNCSDQMITPEFFSEALGVSNSAVRPPQPTPVKEKPASLVQPKAIPIEDISSIRDRVDECIYSSAAALMGEVPFATVAPFVAADLLESIGSKWANKGTFKKLIQSISLLKVAVDWDNEKFVIPGFSATIPDWDKDDNDLLADFVVHIYPHIKVPLLSPATYQALFDTAIEEWKSDGLTYTERVKNTHEKCLILGHKLTAQQIRFVLKGASLQGQPITATRQAREISSAFRSHIFQTCGTPDWMLEAAEARRLATWIRASDETIDEAASALVSQSVNAEPVG